jgi:fumarate reductase flavoprotein subunit
MTAKSGLTKRQLLTSAGVLAGAAIVSGWQRALAAAGPYDVIVVGGGTAGMPTALFAAARGAKVLLIERSGLLGGTLDRSAGQIAAAGTRFQAAKGIADTPDDHFADIMHISEATCDPALARLWADNGAATIDWLADLGFAPLPEHPVIEGAHEAFLIPRYLWGKDGGRSIMWAVRPAVEQAAAAGRIDILFHTGAVELMQDTAGAVTGVITENNYGARAEHRARNVVLASGGCASNPRLFQELHGVPLYARAAYPYSQGKGIEMGVAAGGYVRGGEKYLCAAGSILLDHNYPSPIFAGAALDPRQRKAWEIWVNRRGERFVREDHPSIHHREHALLKQPGMRSWVVFDQAMLDAAPPLVPSLPRAQLETLFNFHPMFTKADTLEALARRMDIPAAGLVATVRAFNQGQSAGKDIFGRAHLPLPLAQGPFYAVETQGMTIISFAGLAVDDSLRVLQASGEPVKGLYAAGEVIGAGATSGNAYTNGSMVTPALTFGRLLGQRILPLAA